jgi:hypothetical protein
MELPDSTENHLTQQKTTWTRPFNACMNTPMLQALKRDVHRVHTCVHVQNAWLDATVTRWLSSVRFRLSEYVAMAHGIYQE